MPRSITRAARFSGVFALLVSLAASATPVSEPYDELERLEASIAAWLEPADRVS